MIELLNYDFSLLILPSLMIFFFGILVSQIVTKNILVSIFIGLLKSFIFFIYFGFIFDGTWTLQDDWMYYEEVSYLKNEGFSFLDLISNHFFELPIIIGHLSFVYQVYALIGFDLFGNYYFSPIPVNIVLTFFTGYFIYKLLIIFEFSYKYSKFFYIFFILHWDVIVWSNFVNLKDTLVLFLTVYMFYTYYNFRYNKMRILYFILFIMTLLILLNLRFYIPILFIVAIFITFLFTFYIKRNAINKIFFVIPIATIFVSVVLMIQFLYPHAFDLISKTFVNPIYGLLKVFLTPIPFNQAENLNFLVFSSLLHWLMMPFLLYGIYIFMKNYQFYDKYIYVFLTYSILLLVVYGISDQFHTPRHRVQILFIITFFQYYGFIKFINKLKKRKIGNKSCVE